MKDFLHHFLFPRESNNHRAKLLHHDSLLVIICLFLFFTSLFSAVHNTYPQVLGISSNISVSDLLTLTNEKRKGKGLVPLQMNSQLAQAADQKAQHMFVNNYWAHIAPDGTTPWYFIKNSGYEYLYAGENLARGFTTAPAVVDAWMASPTHRDNMLSPNYKDIGFAIATGTLTGSETILVVEELGSQYPGDSDTQSAATTASSPTPTPVSVLGVSPQVTQSVLQGISPTPVTKLEHQPAAGVAAVANEPLFDSKSMSKTFSFALLFVLLAVLVVDAILIEKRKIARVVGHNIDHVIFLVIIILVIIIVGRGLIL